MKLTRAHVRFFRSFNFDYERKVRSNVEPPPWEVEDGQWHPFVRVDIDPEITAVVGANEAGKSQLLAAVLTALGDRDIQRGDFCRYSELYSVEKGKRRLPEFGASFRLEDSDRDLRERVPELQQVGAFTLFKPGSKPPFVVVGEDVLELSAEKLKVILSALPETFVLETNLAIPSSVSIRELAGEAAKPLHDRGRRVALIDSLSSIDPETLAESIGTIKTLLTRGRDRASVDAEKKRVAEFALARMLLVDIAHVERETFEDLQNAIDAGKEGETEAIIGGINDSIKDNLNIQRWWTQDREFDLLVEPRERELAFTIRDRTSSKYSFDERSQGLRFFLSYFVQVTAHMLVNSAPDVLLLDEPDAYLSSTGQQDLLRVLRHYTQPEDSSEVGGQVIYVTHSPFLIDKNSPGRIRVLDKGSDDLGTRVVPNGSINRYEPLRSSIGAHVAETAFVGGKNLFVEGLVDQVLICGLNNAIAEIDELVHPIINLNDVTVVDCGGADSVPYMVYLARGRDSIKPPSVALLDGDKSGRDAEKVLRRGEARKKRILRDEYILRLDSWAQEAGIEDLLGRRVMEIEDLLPVPVVRRAALNYLARFRTLVPADFEHLTVAGLTAAIEQQSGNVWDGLLDAYQEAFPDEHIEKAGLAHEIVDLARSGSKIEGVSSLLEAFRRLLAHLSTLLDDADSEENRRRAEDRLDATIRAFDKDYPRGIKKRDARRLIREIEHSLGDSEVRDKLVPLLPSIVREFDLDDSSSGNVTDFEEFSRRVHALKSEQELAYQDDAVIDPASTIEPVGDTESPAAEEFTGE